MKFPFDALQEAIYLRLAGDPEITPDVFDWPVNPEEQRTPYIVVGSYFTEDESTSTVSGQRVTSDIEVWSDARGMREINDIMNEIVQSLSSSALDLSSDGFEFLQISTTADARREFDGSDTFQHGTVRRIDVIYEEEIS